MKKIALSLSVAALFAAAAPSTHAQSVPMLEMEVQGKGLDLFADELKLRAKCSATCTVALQHVNVLRISRKGQQLPGAGQTLLKGSKKLPSGRPTTFRIPLNPWTRTHFQSAISAGDYAAVQVAVKLNGMEGPYRQATFHAPNVPKSPMGQDDYSVSLKPKLPSKPARYRVTIEGVQTTKWSYNRNETNGSCTTVSNGSGNQTVRFRSTKPAFAKMSYGPKGAVLVPAKGAGPFRPTMRLTAQRDGQVNSGLEGDCGGGEVPSGGGGPGGPQECIKTGDQLVWALFSFTGRNKLTLGIDPNSFLAWLGDEEPNCPIEHFKDADANIDVLDAVHKLADPGGRAGKVILIARGSKTDQLGGGSTTTKVRWTVTFKKVGR